MSVSQLEGLVSSRPDVSGPESVRRDTRLLLVSNDAMRARRRPGAVIIVYLFQLVLSFVVAWPVSRGLAATFSGHPRGDSVLFDDGGWALLALRTAYDRATPSIWGLVVLVTLVGAVVGLVPLAALLTSISHATPDLRAPRPRHLAPYVVLVMRPLVTMQAMGSALELALLAVAAWAFGFVRESLQPRFGDARADQIAVLACAVTLLAAGAASVVHDLARAAAVRFRAGTFAAIRSALVTFRHKPVRIFWSWAWRGLASLVLVIIVAWLVPHLSALRAVVPPAADPHLSALRAVVPPAADPQFSALRAVVPPAADPQFGPRATASLVAIALIHQLVALARVSLRASWLARALRAVDSDAAERRRHT